MLVNLPNPIPEFQHTPLPPQVLRTKEHALTINSSIVFTSDSHLSISKSLGAHQRMMDLITRFPQQFETTTWKVNFTFLPYDIQLIQKKHMELFGPVDLIISSWECQGFSTAGFGEGLNDTKSSLFTDMVRLITWVQSISPTLGYVIENTPSQLNQREKIQEHYTLVKHYLREPLLFYAAQCGSYAHWLHNWWTNLAPLSILQLAMRYTIRDPNLQVSHILDD